MPCMRLNQQNWIMYSGNITSFVTMACAHIVCQDKQNTSTPCFERKKTQFWAFPGLQSPPCCDCVKYHCTSGMPMCMANLRGIYCRHIGAWTNLQRLGCLCWKPCLTHLPLQLPLLGILTDTVLSRDWWLALTLKQHFCRDLKPQLNPQDIIFTCSHAYKCKQCIWRCASSSGITHPMQETTVRFRDESH